MIFQLGDNEARLYKKLELQIKGRPNYPKERVFMKDDDLERLVSIRDDQIQDQREVVILG